MRLPGMFYAKENVVAGGFMAYGTSVPDLIRRDAGYVHRILQGAKPADLPVEPPTAIDVEISSRIPIRHIGSVIYFTFDAPKIMVSSPS
jgi:ABC-type uncharacterized transport system substrate-binding protein